MYKVYESILIEYAESLLNLQFDNLDGGIFCPSCKSIHGRCIDAIYALCVCYKKYKIERYLKSAIKLFNYSNNLLCKDGGIYNDLQNEWRGTTVFHTIDLLETLNSCKDILTNDFVSKLEDRVKLCSKWLYENITINTKGYINYVANNALALLLSGKYFNNNDYIKQSHSLLDYVLNHVSNDGFIYGEVYPHNLKSDNNCYGIDLGYNLEETLPAIAKFAYYTKDNNLLNKVYKISLSHLNFILPDGAIDNSFGVRNFKWTYYGSRTCDGMIPLCLILGSIDKRFIEAINRNISLINRCSYKGILYGGPDYNKSNIKPCIHHTFEHINAIAFAIDNYSKEVFKVSKLKLPCDEEFNFFLKDFNSYRISNKKYILCISNYDNNIPFSGHLTGGSITLLFSKEKREPLIVGSVGDYQLVEPLNMQVPFDRVNHRPGYPRIEKYVDNKYYTSGYSLNANIQYIDECFSFNSNLYSRDGKCIKGKYKYSYSLKEDGLSIKITHNQQFIYIVPLINGEITILKGKIINITNTFFLTPGFISKEYQIESIDNEVEILLK